MKELTNDDLRAALRKLPSVPPPASLGTQLRVMASREAQRRQMLRSPRALAKFAVDKVRLWSDHLMRPYAVPCAGGLLSSFFLFALLAPSYPLRDMATDVPAQGTRGATLVSSFALNVASDDIVVDVSIDDQGRVVDYTVPAGQNWATNPELRRSLESMLLLTKFIPATHFGYPSTGKTRIRILKSQVDVRG